MCHKCYVICHPPVDSDVYVEPSLDQSYSLSEQEVQVRLFVILATQIHSTDSRQMTYKPSVSTIHAFLKRARFLSATPGSTQR